MGNQCASHCGCDSNELNTDKNEIPTGKDHGNSLGANAGSNRNSK